MTGSSALAQMRFARGVPIALEIGNDAGLRAFALADVDADGDVDLATVAEDLEDCDAITVLLNGGNGTFAAPRFYPDEENDLVRPSSVLVADVGAPLASPPDGNVDVVAMTIDGVGVIAFGDGTGNFQLAALEERIDISLDLDGDAIGAVVSEFDGENGPDLAVLDDDGFVLFLCNTGFGTFDACSDYILATGGEAPVTLGVGDVDGNGQADVIVLDRGPTRNAPGSLSVFLGGGEGRFTLSSPLSLQPEPTDLAVGRINDDAIDDVVVSFIEPLGGDSIQTFLGRAGGPLLARPLVQSVSFGPAALAIADFDQDGVNDLVAPQQSDTDFFTDLMRGNGLGGFELVPFTGNGASTGLGRAVASADLDGDTNPDFVVLRADGSELRVAINVSDEIPTPTPTPTDTPLPTLTATQTQVPSRTPSLRPSPSPTETSVATPTSSASATMSGGDEDDGCAVGPGSSRGASGSLLFAAVWAVARRWRRRRAPARRGRGAGST
jgi:hypothetical protein